MAVGTTSCQKEAIHSQALNNQWVKNSPKYDAKLSGLVKNFSTLHKNPSARLSSSSNYSFLEAYEYFENVLYSSTVTHGNEFIQGHLITFEIDNIFDAADNVSETELLSLVETYYDLIDDSLQNYTFYNANEETMSGTRYVALVNVKWANPETQVDAIVEVVFGITSGTSISTSSSYAFAPFTDLGCGTSNNGQPLGAMSIANLILNDCASNPDFKPTWCTSSTFGLSYTTLDYRFAVPVLNNQVIVANNPYYEPNGPLWVGNHSDCWSFGTSVARGKDIGSDFTAPSGEEMVLYWVMNSVDLSLTDPTNYPNKGAWLYRDWAGIAKYIDEAPHTSPTYVQ